MNDQLTILVSGMIAADPFQGGATWAVLQYLLGFAELGHDVYFIEPLPLASLRPSGSRLPASRNAAYFESVISEFNLTGRAALLLAGTQQTLGLPYPALCQIARRADVLINISGMLADPQLIAPIPRRIYLDLDPAFIQLWHAVEKIDMRFDAHTHFVTVGQTLDHPGSPIPTCGRHWLKSLPPIVLSRWPVADAITNDALTTVGSWRGYGSVTHHGVRYGQKAHSLRLFLDLPRRMPIPLRPALAIDLGETADLAALAQNGWQLLDPALVAATPTAYQRFIQGSRGEWSIAKSGYVLSRCGWFSDRSACYLASGRPVIAQDTGFGSALPTGRGLLTFSTADESVAAAESLLADYPAHARAARTLAEEHLDSRRVLTRLLELTREAP